MTEYERFCRMHGSFMQSEQWAAVKSTWDSRRVIVSDSDDRIKGTMQLLIKRIPLLHASVLYAPRGPVCDYHDRSTISGLLKQAEKVAAEIGAVMLGFDPLIDSTDYEAIDLLTSEGALYHPERMGYDTVQCRENYQLDIAEKDADEVFSSFRSKHRYNIRLAERRGVECGFYNAEKLNDFCRMMKETAARDGFRTRSMEYFARILNAFNENAGLCMCYHDGVPLSGALYIEYGGVMSYVYGCSSNDHRELMPNYLMQWTMIRKAIRDGCHTYDFCGIPYWYDPEHQNYGVYRFKKGFSGTVRTYAGEFEVIYRPTMYKILKAGMRLRKML